MDITLAIIKQKQLVIPQSQLETLPDLVREFQTHLARIGLYPQDLIDGIWGKRTQQAIVEFCRIYYLNNHVSLKYGNSFAQKLLEAKPHPLDIAPEAVAKICKAPVSAVRIYLPQIIQALKAEGIYSKRCLVAALATVGTEVPNFSPINEMGGSAYFTKHYEGRSDLGNIAQGDGARYHGRGFIQLTGRANYRAYGKRLGIDLENNPELALNPKIAAQVLALYFKDRQIHHAAERSNWRQVRKAVNGGYNGWTQFAELVTILTGHLGC